MSEPGYIELRCRSAFSFLSGASLPEDLAARAAELGYPALALSDREGVFAAPRFYKAAKEAGIRPLVGAEAVIEGHPLLLLCESEAGYRNLCRLLTDSRLGGPRSFEDLERGAEGLHALTGGAEGAIGAALDAGDGERAALALDRLVGIFGPNHLAVELQVHLEEQQDRRNAALLSLARRYQAPLVLTNDVRMATPVQADLLDVLTCIQAGTQLEVAGTLLLRNAERYLKAPTEMVRLVSDLPEAAARSVEIAGLCRFTLGDLKYRFPLYPLPPGERPATFLRTVVKEAAPQRFRPFTEAAERQLARELDLIERLGMEGYFLIVWDLIQFCRARGILVQGRGSAANSAVCFALGITACDPLRYDLLFERFLSEERGEWPDIDLDLPAGEQREEAIQYLYRKYGERACALVATVISYRLKSAVRDVGKALGFHPSQLDPVAEALSAETEEDRAALAGPLRVAGLDRERGQHLLRLVGEIQELPRHLGQHPGGMVLADGRLDEIVPLQPARMPGRVVLQWDRDDCRDLSLLKIDLLGLGMLAALDKAQRLCPAHDGVPFDLSALPADDPQVYKMLQQADTVGLFQVESRAQMATLPRLRPRCFYDLVVEVALIRPGPVVGQMVHPYLRRRSGKEQVNYPHPELEPILSRTLGVPLFQEQLMRVAMIAAGFSGGQAEQLRRAMGSKRSAQKMAALVNDLRAGMAQRGIAPEAAEQIVRGITSFAEYGFPESHAISFALLSYASAYLRVHHPAVFYASLLNVQPMGCYHPATLVKDAQRHGVRFLPVDVQHSGWDCSIEGTERPARTVRLGLRYVRGMREAAGRALVTARQDGPFSSIGDLRRRGAALRDAELETLAEIGAFAGLPGHPRRRDALWQVAALQAAGGPLLQGRHGSDEEEDDSPLPEMTLAERIEADYRGTSLTVGPHPLALYRERLHQAGVLRSVELAAQPSGSRIKVAGVVIVRQRPETAKGYVFFTLEDEGGVSNIIVAPKVFQAERALLVSAQVLVVEGTVQNEEGVCTVRGQRFSSLDEPVAAIPSHDFH